MIYSNDSFLSVNSGLVPKFAQSDLLRNSLWRPSLGVWYAAEKFGKVPGGEFGAGIGQWRQKSVPLMPGDRFRLVRQGNPASPSIWEVQFCSPLR